MVDISINALHDPVSIVHIPIEAAQACTTRLYWTLDRATADSSEFFNLTSNRIEIALFAASALVEDEWGPVAHGSSVYINGPWRVFEITSGDDGSSGGMYDSPHLRHVSAPLAEAGISILYQSSYFTDFLLVAERDFERASAIFRAKRWQLELPPRPHNRRSVLLASDIIELGVTPDAPEGPPIAEITVLQSPLTCVGFSPELEAQLGVRLRKFLVWPRRAVLAFEHERGKAADHAVNAYVRQMERSNGDVPLRSPLTPDGSTFASWASARARRRPRPFISYTRTEEGASMLTEVRVLRAMLSPAERACIGTPELEGSDSEWYDDEPMDDDEEDVDDRPRPASSVETGQGTPNLDSESVTPASAGSGDSPGTPAVGAATPSPRGRQPGRASLLSIHSLQSLHLSETAGEIPFQWSTPPSTPRSPGGGMNPGVAGLTPMMASRSASGNGSGGEAERAKARDRDMPCLVTAPIADGRTYVEASGRVRSHTRTRSETVVVGALPQDTGAGVVEPTRARRASEGPAARDGWVPLTTPGSDGAVSSSGRSDGDAGDDTDDPRASLMRCLQLDLRAFDSDAAYHLHKSGLVMRFSDPLHKGGVRMMYSSTTHTANILVEGRDVIKAQKLLVPAPAGTA